MEPPAVMWMLITFDRDEAQGLFSTLAAATNAAHAHHVHRNKSTTALVTKEWIADDGFYRVVRVDYSKD